MGRRQVTKGAPFFYGWVVMAVATFAMTLTVAGNGVGLAVFLDPILADIGVTRSLASMFFTVATLAAAASLPLLGRALDRFGARITLTLVSLGFAGSCLLMGSIDSAVGLGIGLLCLRLLGLGALRLVSIHAVNQWFVTRRGRVIGYAGVAVALMMGVFPALLGVAVAEIGWRSTYLAFGLLVALVLTPAAALLMRSSPEQMGLRPDGRAQPPEEPEAELNQARRSSMLWTIIVSDLIVALFIGGAIFHHYDLAASHGIDRNAAGAIFLPFGIASALAILAVGFTLRKASPRFAMSTMLLAAAAVMLLSLRLELALLPLYGFVLGLTQGTKDAVQANAYAYYFGRRNLGAIAGLGSAFSLFGVSLGPTLFAWVRAASGSYLLLSLAGLVLLLLSLAPVVLARDPRRDRSLLSSARS